MKKHIPTIMRGGTMAAAAACLLSHVCGQQPPANPAKSALPSPPAATTPPVAPWKVDCKITRLGVVEGKQGIEAVLTNDLAPGGARILAKGAAIRSEAALTEDALRADADTKWLLVPAPGSTPADARVLSGRALAMGNPGLVKVGQAFELSVTALASVAALAPSPTPTPVRAVIDASDKARTEPTPSPEKAKMPQK